jgi:hypothetical protein
VVASGAPSDTSPAALSTPGEPAWRASLADVSLSSGSAPTLAADALAATRRRGRRLVMATMLLAVAGAIAFVVTVRHGPGGAVDARAVEVAPPSLLRTSAALHVEPVRVEPAAMGLTRDEPATSPAAAIASARADKPAATATAPARLRTHPVKRITARPRSSAAWDPEAPLLPH